MRTLIPRLMLIEYLDGANLVTGLNVMIAILAIMLISIGMTSLPILLVFTAILLDHLDGYLARRFYADNKVNRAFGKQFDTLADIINFNVVTALMVFKQFTAQPLIAGAIAIALVLFGAIRLSHFTLQSGNGVEASYGLQTPYSAFIVINLLMLHGAELLSTALTLVVIILCTLLQITCIPIRMPGHKTSLITMCLLFGINLWVSA